MPDRETVIKDLEEYRDREYIREGITYFDNDPRYRRMIINNALALLKKPEARWISVPHKKARICSHCEADEPYKFAEDDAEVYEYCPHCGAKMTEGPVKSE